MKKLLLAVLLSLCLVFTLTACSSGSSDTSGEEEEVVEETLDVPYSDVEDGTGLQGTWERVSDNDEILGYTVLAINSDDTFSLYYDVSGADDQFTQAVVDGTYTAEGDKLTLTYDEGSAESLGDEEITASFEALEDQTSFTYKADATTLTLTGSDHVTFTFDRQVFTDAEEDTTDDTTGDEEVVDETETETQE